MPALFTVQKRGNFYQEYLIDILAGRRYKGQRVTVHRQEFSELKIPYDTVLAADFADLECAASTKSRCWAHVCEQ
ncbi:hypothetical protein DXB70_11185 [Clostridium sp. OM05-5BH]|nr:hypothetical protein DXB70_11185 [Clostridium sp. OM05-5BH]